MGPPCSTSSSTATSPGPGKQRPSPLSTARASKIVEKIIPTKIYPLKMLRNCIILSVFFHFLTIIKSKILFKKITVSLQFIHLFSETLGI
jgi:hypothetical protein